MAIENANPLYGSEVALEGVDGVSGNRLEHRTHMASGTSIYDAESQILRGTMSFSFEKLKELDPSYTGFTHVFVLRLPPVLVNAAKGWQVDNFDPSSDIAAVNKAKAHCQNLKALFEMGCTSYSGTPDLTLNLAEVNVGWSERSYSAPTYSAYDGKQFTLKVLETRGEPLRRGLEYYISAVADPNTKTAMLNGALKAQGGALLDPTLSNFTWSFMIVQTDQTLLNVQDIALWNNCIPNGIARDNLDWDQGTVDIVQPKDVQFNGVYMPNTDNKFIRAWADKLMATRAKYYKRYRDMTNDDIGTKYWHEPGFNFSAGAANPSDGTAGTGGT